MINMTNRAYIDVRLRSFKFSHCLTSFAIALVYRGHLLQVNMFALT